MQEKKPSNSISRGVTVSVLLCFDGKRYWKECCEWRLLSNVPSGVPDTDCLALPVCSTKSHLRLRYNRWLGSRPNCDRIQSVQFSHYHPSVSARLATPLCASLSASGSVGWDASATRQWWNGSLITDIYTLFPLVPDFPTRDLQMPKVLKTVLVYLLMPKCSLIKIINMK